MPNNVPPTDDDLRKVFANSMWYEIVYTFGVPRHDPWDYCQWEFINFTRMGHARVLYDFFETTKEKRKLDDVIAEDFGFPAQSGLRSQDDKDRLNKDLFHLSYGRLRHTEKTKTKPWPDSIISNLLEPTLGFMRYIRDSRSDVFSSSLDAEKWRDTITLLESGRELQIASVEDENGELFYGLKAGPPLPNGKPVLTEFIHGSVEMLDIGNSRNATPCT